MSDLSTDRAAGADSGPASKARQRKLSENDVHTAMQSHARYLSGTSPEGRANFIGCILPPYVFPGNQSLARVQFQHSIVKQCTLAGKNDLAGADFSGAEICNSSLAGAFNLKEARFGTAKFSEVTFPANFSPDELTRSVREHGPRIEKLFYTLLVTCTTAGILAWISPDEQVFRQSGIITLPFLSFGVPIGTFFALTPWLLFIFHVYFLTALLRFWRDLRNVPTAIASDRPVYHEFPIFPNFAVPLKLWGRYNRRETDNAGGPLRRLLSSCFDLFYLAVAPIAQVVIWARYLPAQTLASSVSQSTAISFSIAAIGYAVLRGNAQHRQGLRVVRPARQETSPPADPVDHATRARTIGHGIRRVRDFSLRFFKGQAASFVIDTKTRKRNYVGQHYCPANVRRCISNYL